MKSNLFERLGWWWSWVNLGTAAGLAFKGDITWTILNGLMFLALQFVTSWHRSRTPPE